MYISGVRTKKLHNLKLKFFSYKKSLKNLKFYSLRNIFNCVLLHFSIMTLALKFGVNALISPRAVLLLCCPLHKGVKQFLKK